MRALDGKDTRVPETLQRVRQRLDAVFEDAIFHKRCTSNPAAAIRRKMRESLPRKAAGQFTALPYKEAAAFMSRLRAAEGIAARCLEFAVLTAARTTEAIMAEWSEFDLDAALWVVPAARMKAKEAHAVYLSTSALDILKAQQALGMDANLVFPSPRLDGKALSNMAMLTVLGRMGMRDRTTVPDPEPPVALFRPSGRTAQEAAVRESGREVHAKRLQSFTARAARPSRACE